MHQLKIPVVIALVVITFGCKKETVPSVSGSFNYFPVNAGSWIIYDVDSIFHAENDADNDDSVYYFHFEVMEKIDSSYLDGAGEEAHILSRYRRYNSTEQWSFMDVWTQKINARAAYKTENNISYHKLAFPFSSSLTWNGNDANTLPEETYSYDYFHKPGMIGGLTFDSTLSVIQVDEDNFVETIFGQEVYAAGVGLIYKQRDDLGKRNGLVVKGTEYKMSVIAFGRD